MSSLDLSMLVSACTPGGASVLTSVTDLVPAGGSLAGVAPARFVRGNDATYAYEDRFDGEKEESVKVVLIDSKGSQANRVEAALAQGIGDGHPQLKLTPRIELRYPGRDPISCLELPHRAWEGHLRAGTVEGTPLVKHPAYVEARNVTAANARPLLELSAASVGFGSWDASRRKDQVRFRSPLVGEIVGVLAAPDAPPPLRGGARVDDISPSVRLTPDNFERVLDRQQHELSGANLEKLRKAVSEARKKKTLISAAALGLGNIPPSLDSLGLVSCRKIVRHHVLSFAALRQLRFGLGYDGDVSVRAMIAAWVLTGLAYSDAELNLRANCDLREAGPSRVVLDGRYGAEVELEPLNPQAMSSVLDDAIRAAVAEGLRWEGQVLHVDGDPSIIEGAEHDDDSSGSGTP